MFGSMAIDSELGGSWVVVFELPVLFSLVPPGPLFICVFRGPGTRSHVTLDTT